MEDNRKKMFQIKIVKKNFIFIKNKNLWNITPLTIHVRLDPIFVTYIIQKSITTVYHKHTKI